MKHIFRQSLAIALIFAVAAGVTGCGKKVGDIKLNKGTNAIYINEDGVVRYGVGESFQSDDYDEEELEEYINKEVSDYNSSTMASVDDAIKVEKFDVDDDVAYLILNIATVYDFNEYFKEYNKENEESFYAGKVSDCRMVHIKGNFVSPDRKKTAQGADIRKMDDSNILVLNGQYRVQIDGDVKYISENCKTGDNGVITTAESDSGLSYIVY